MVSLEFKAMNTKAAVHFEYLDGWRGLAIILVLVGHFFPIETIDLANFGVELFFVLSGRLMADILFVRRMALPPFFLRRFSRVYPGMLAFVLLAALAFQASSIRVGPLGMLSALTFTINYASLYVHPTGIFDHLWSLCVEEHAYLLLGFTALICRRFGRAASPYILTLGLTALANGLVQTEIYHHTGLYVSWRSDIHVAPIMLAAWLYLFLKTHKLPFAEKLSPLFMGLATLCKLGYGATIALINVGLGTFCLVLAMGFLDTAPKILHRLLSFAPLRRIGLWSYSLYLWQQPFYKMHEIGHCYWPFPAAILTGLLSFYFIENPLRRWLNNKIQTRFGMIK